MGLGTQGFNSPRLQSSLAARGGAIDRQQEYERRIGRARQEVFALKLERRRSKRVKEASKTMRGVRSIYIKNFEASVENGKVMQYRVNAKVSFDLDTGRNDKGGRRKK